MVVLRSMECLITWLILNSDLIYLVYAINVTRIPRLVIATKITRHIIFFLNSVLQQTLDAVTSEVWY